MCQSPESGYLCKDIISEQIRDCNISFKKVEEIWKKVLTSSVIHDIIVVCYKREVKISGREK